MTRRNLLSVVFSFVFAFSLAGSAFAADASAPGDKSVPASSAQVDQVAKFFKVLSSRIGRHDERILDMFTEEGKMASFGTTDPAQIKEVINSLNRMVVYQIDVRVQDDILFATVSYTGIGDPTIYTTSEFQLVQVGNDLAINSFVTAPLSFPDGKTVRKVTLKVTDKGFKIKSTIEVGDFLLLKVRNESSDQSSGSIGIYRIADTSTYEATVQAGQPLTSEQRMTAVVVMAGQAGEFAFVGFDPGEYIIVDGRLGDGWASGPTAHFTVK